jgi:hypothetical protein
MTLTTIFTVTTEASLNTAIAEIDTTGADAATNTAYTIDFADNIKLLGTVARDAINRDSGSTLTINDDGDTLDGTGAQRGLFVYAGTVDVGNLAIDDDRRRDRRPDRVHRPDRHGPGRRPLVVAGPALSVAPARLARRAWRRTPRKTLQAKAD